MIITKWLKRYASDAWNLTALKWENELAMHMGDSSALGFASCHGIALQPRSYLHHMLLRLAPDRAYVKVTVPWNCPGRPGELPGLEALSVSWSFVRILHIFGLGFRICLLLVSPNENLPECFQQRLV